MNNNRTIPINQSDLCQTPGIGDSLVTKSIAAEEEFLATFWLYPAKGVDAAQKAGLTQTAFTSCRHSFLFALIQECETLGIEANLQHVEQLAPIEAAFDKGDIEPIVYPDRFIYVADLDSLAESVVEFAAQRLEVSELWRQLIALCGNDFKEFCDAS